LGPSGEAGELVSSYLVIWLLGCLSVCLAGLLAEWLAGWLNGEPASLRTKELRESELFEWLDGSWL